MTKHKDEVIKVPDNLKDVAKRLSGSPFIFDDTDLEALLYLQKIGVAADFDEGSWGRGYKWKEFISKA